tara:strand:- start:82 stop:522 length:441 start_codon:yes stop_codon:yes gene_type:complete
MNKKEAFRAFNISVTNPRQSWSGINKEEGIVALTIWTDQREWLPEGRFYKTQVPETDLEFWQNLYGNKERKKIIKYCIENLNSQFWAIFCKPKEEIYGEAREAEWFKPNTKLMHKITSFDEETGIFSSRGDPASQDKYEEIFRNND